MASTGAAQQRRRALRRNLAKLTSAPQDAGSMELRVLHSAFPASLIHQKIAPPPLCMAVLLFASQEGERAVISDRIYASGMRRAFSECAAQRQRPPAACLAPPVRAMYSTFADRVFGWKCCIGWHTRVSTAGIDPVAFISSRSPSRKLASGKALAHDICSMQAAVKRLRQYFLAASAASL